MVDRNMEEIKENIKNQILETNKVFQNFWRKNADSDLVSVDIEALNSKLKGIKRFYEFYRIGAIIGIVIFTGVSLMPYFDKFEIVQIKNTGLLIFWVLGFMIHTFRYYKLKVNLEHKIYLIKLLKDIK